MTAMSTCSTCRGPSAQDRLRRSRSIPHGTPGESGTVTFFSPTTPRPTVAGTLTFSEIENVIPAFTPGSLIATPRGEVPVESGCAKATRSSPATTASRRSVGSATARSTGMNWPPCAEPPAGADQRRVRWATACPNANMLRLSRKHRVLIAGDRPSSSSTKAKCWWPPSTW